MGKNTNTAGCYILHDENAIDNLKASTLNLNFGKVSLVSSWFREVEEAA